MAGDTAQTVARGVSFRFQALKNLLYRYYMGLGAGQAPGQAQAAVSEILQVSEEGEKVLLHPLLLSTSYC